MLWKSELSKMETQLLIKEMMDRSSLLFLTELLNVLRNLRLIQSQNSLRIISLARFSENWLLCTMRQELPQSVLKKNLFVSVLIEILLMQS
jgi:hypothetical protein